MCSATAQTPKQGTPTRAGPVCAIIGAGLAGLTAARRLSADGLQVVVFDKGRGPGGRCSVRRNQDHHFDHGAQYLTVRDARFRREVNDWLDAGVVQEWGGRIVAIGARGTRRSASVTRYVGVPGMNAIARHLARGLQIRLGVRVGQVERVHSWQLWDDRGSRLGSFDALIVALPAAQAAALLAEFPVVAAEARACPLAPCWAVLAAFDGPLEVSFDGAFVEDERLGWAARNNAKPLRPRGESWVLHATSTWSADQLHTPADEVAGALLAAFGHATGQAIPEPRHLMAHRWRYALPPAPLSVGCLGSDDHRVAVCGDWCAGARIEGAYLSGIAAADRILGMLKMARPAD